MKSVRIALVGASGRMGQEILAVGKNSNCEICYLMAKKEMAKKGLEKKAFKFENLAGKEVDLVVDFSSPEGLSEALRWCVKNKVAFLSGTTGGGAAQEIEILQAAKSIPVFWSANFSVGIALVTEMLKVYSGHSEFDLQIEEQHHRDKKDRPSGTAKSLQLALEKIVKKEIPQPVSIRGGGIFGNHKIWAMSSTENITIEHTALNRSVFAEGAIRAGRWLIGQKPGSYTMQDLLRATRVQPIGTY